MFGCLVFGLSAVHCTEKSLAFKRVRLRQWHTKAQEKKRVINTKIPATPVGAHPKPGLIVAQVCDQRYAVKHLLSILKMTNYYSISPKRIVTFFVQRENIVSDRPFSLGKDLDPTLSTLNATAWQHQKPARLTACVGTHWQRKRHRNVTQCKTHCIHSHFKSSTSSFQSTASSLARMT